MNLLFGLFFYLVVAGLADANQGVQIQQRVITLLQQAALVDPDGREQTTLRKNQRQRQRELRSWFEDHGKSLSLSQCKTKQDRKNYLDFRATMANEVLLKMPLRKRKAFITDVRKRLQPIADNWTVAWRPFAAHPLPDTLPTIKPRYFGFGAFTTTAALYHPPSQAIYLNLNYAIDDPEGLCDSLEHELWHHFLPPVHAQSVYQTPWFEGQTEFCSELWSHSFRKDFGSHSVEYPLQTALVSLFYAQAPRQTIDWAFGDPDTLATALPAYLQTALTPWAVDTERSADLRQLLAHWGWKDNQGRPGPDFSGAITDGRFAPETTAKWFRGNRRLLLDLLQAIVVCELRNAREAGLTPKAVRRFDLPPHLRDNLRHVLEYVANPRRQYANR